MKIFDEKYNDIDLIMKGFKYRLVLTGICCALVLTGCKKEDAGRSANPRLRNVLLTEVEGIGSTISKKYSGVIEEGKSVNAAFMTGGKLASLKVKEGDRVRKGQLLATLDDTDYLIGVNQLKIQYNQMVAEKARMDEMFARHNVAPNDYEKFVAGFEQLGLQLEMAKNKLDYTRLYAPTDGFISYKYMEPGELVDAGTSIYKITDDSNLEVAVDLPAAIYLNKKDIAGAYGIVPGVKGNIPLTIESFTPDADNNQLYHMRLGVPSAYSKELTTGMNISVVIDMENEVAGESYIPSRSIFDENGTTFVWVFNENDSTISKKSVNVIGQTRGNKSVVTGLDGTEKIVSAGIKQLNDREKVLVAPTPGQN